MPIHNISYSLFTIFNHFIKYICYSLIIKNDVGNDSDGCKMGDDCLYFGIFTFRYFMLLFEDSKVINEIW